MTCIDCETDRAKARSKNRPAGRWHNPACIHCCARFIQLLLAHPALCREARRERAGKALRELVALGHSEKAIRELVAQSGPAWASSGANPKNCGAKK